MTKTRTATTVMNTLIRSAGIVGIVMSLANGCVPRQVPNVAELRNINGTSLFVKTIGSGEPIVVVHGGPGLNHTYMLPGLAALANTHRLIFYDQRGGGQTEGLLTEENITFANFVADIEGVREEFGLERMNLFGHSFGAYLATAYAVEYPDRIRTLILSNPIEAGHRYDSLANVRGLAARIRQDSIDLAALQRSEGLANRDPQAVAAMFRVSFRPMLHDRGLTDQLKIEFTPAGARAVFEVGRFLYSSGQREDLWDGLRNVYAPALAIGGASDVVPIELLEDLAEALPNGSMTLIGEAGHFPFIERPDEYAAAIQAFLAAN